MTQYNTSNVKLSNSQLIKLKSAMKNRTEVILNLSSNLIFHQISFIKSFPCYKEINGVSL